MEHLSAEYNIDESLQRYLSNDVKSCIFYLLVSALDHGLYIIHGLAEIGKFCHLPKMVPFERSLSKLS